jgi:hypothetical protein
VPRTSTVMRRVEIAKSTLLRSGKSIQGGRPGIGARAGRHASGAPAMSRAPYARSRSSGLAARSRLTSSLVGQKRGRPLRS